MLSSYKSNVIYDIGLFYIFLIEFMNVFDVCDCSC